MNTSATAKLARQRSALNSLPRPVAAERFPGLSSTSWFFKNNFTAQGIRYRYGDRADRMDPVSKSSGLSIA